MARKGMGGVANAFPTCADVELIWLAARSSTWLSADELKTSVPGTILKLRPCGTEPELTV